MSHKSNERKGPWQHAAVAALQGASIEEQLQYLDPDLVPREELTQDGDGPGLGLGVIVAAPALAPTAPAPTAPDPAWDDTAANRAAARVWGRWDVHWRGRVVAR